jgi:hypothetical protein
MTVSLDIKGFKTTFSWSAGSSEVRGKRECGNCGNDLGEGGKWHYESCFIHCDICHKEYLYDNWLEENYWDQYWAVERALNNAIRQNPNLGGDEALVVATTARDATPPHKPSELD